MSKHSGKAAEGILCNLEMTAKRYARSEDYALWGAERGASFAKRCLPMRRAERRFAARVELGRVKAKARELCEFGASDDEGALYIKAFEDAFRLQLAVGNQDIEIVVKV